jgi:uncharacterized membrane protein
MKKTVGIILTIISFLMSGYSVLLLAASEFEKANSYNGIDELRAIGIGVLVLSVVLFTVGLFMTSSKSKKQREMEIELSNLKFAKENQ